MKTNLIIDSHYLCQRTVHGLKNVELSANNKPTELFFGFFLTLLKCVKIVRPDILSFCWDSHDSFRKKSYPGYKKRPVKNKTVEELKLQDMFYSQITQLYTSIIPRLGFQNNFLQKGLEADDLMASIVAVNNDMKHVVVTSDKDLYQILNADCSILTLTPKQKFITDRSFINLYRIQPSQWVMAKAVGGCDSDTIEGISGFADPAKSDTSRALAFINNHLKSSKLRDRLRTEESKKIIKRNIELIKLPHKKTQPITIDQQMDLSAKKFIDLFDSFGFNTFVTGASFELWVELFNLK